MDGVWFQSVERKYGMDEAMHHDREAWRVLQSQRQGESSSFLNCRNMQDWKGWQKPYSYVSMQI